MFDRQTDEQTMYRLDAHIIGIYTKIFSFLSLKVAENFSPIALRTDLRIEKLNNRVASLLKTLPC